jgi:hypothetical protein
MADLVTLPEVFAYLNVAADPGGFLAREIRSASARIRTACPVWFLDVAPEEGLSVDLDGGGLFLRPRRLPVNSIESVTDLSGDDEELDAADYGLDEKQHALFLADEDGLPSGELWGVGDRRWRVVYATGFETVPEDVREAAFALIADAWGRRNPRVRSSAVGGVSKSFDGKGLPMEVVGMLARYRELVF